MIQHRLSSLLAVPAAFAVFALAGQQPTPAAPTLPGPGKILCTTSTSQACGALKT